jgi:hypothetical protein
VTAAGSETAFNEQQFERTYPDGIQDHYWTHARNAILLRTLRRMMANHPSATALEVGCGRGVVTEYMRRHGMNVIGVEMGHPRPITPAVGPYLIGGRDALTMEPEFRRQVRAIMLLDVLEHLPEPASFMASLAAAYENCDDFLITVPARQELWSNYDEYYGHFRRFDRKTALELFQREMFEATSVRYVFRLVYLPGLLLSRTGRGRSVVLRGPSPAMRPIHKVLTAYFRLETAVVPQWVAGTSVMMTLKRRRLTK